MAALYEEYDTIQASIDPDALFAAKLQQEDIEQCTIEERAQFLVETIATQRKFRAAQSAQRSESKTPHPKPAKEHYELLYLKNMGGYKHSQLKGKNYEEIHGLYEKQQKRIQDFTPMDSEKKAQKSGKRLKRVAGLSSEQKQDLIDLHKIVMQRFQNGSTVLKLYETCGVHTLILDGTLVTLNMLVERRYPLIKEVLQRMLESRLEADAKSTLALDLIKFIKLQLEE
ncbi:hypothetical protein Tco_0157544 [Tanacetum coccineum]